MENEWCFVCVEGQVARESRVLQPFDGSLSDFKGVAECYTFTLIHDILTNSTEKTFQSGIIDCGISDHQLIFVQEMSNDLNSINAALGSL